MKIFQIMCLNLLLLTLCACRSNFSDADVLSQVSTIDALLDGVYDGTVSCGELKQLGNFGIGTFDALEGEMVVLDGEVYQVKTDGVAYRVDDSEKTPFATVTFFNPDKKIKLPPGLTYKQFEKMVDCIIGSDNLFYAVKITGTFKNMKTRSVPKQKRPYPQLKDVVKHQEIFNLGSVSGTVVGFRSPSYVKGLNVTGYHLHFLTDDLKAGGHILDFTTGNITLEIDTKNNFFMTLPDTKAFRYSNLKKDRTEGLKKVEKNN
jgi:acetolactate decarboxylase